MIDTLGAELSELLEDDPAGGRLLSCCVTSRNNVSEFGVLIFDVREGGGGGVKMRVGQ